MKRETKIQRVYIDYGCGFPVKLINVPMAKVRGEWVVNINSKKLHDVVIRTLIFKPSRLTGSEIRFIRLFHEMTLKEFGHKFDVTHPAVKKWESQGDKSTGMKWSIEKDIRLFTLAQVSPKATEFLIAYHELEEKAESKLSEIKIDLAHVA